MKDSNSLQPSEPLVGKLLVASTTVQDPMLSRSVSLVVHQDAENVFAVLLNRPMAAPPALSKMLQQVGNKATKPGSRIAESGTAANSQNFEYPQPELGENLDDDDRQDLAAAEMASQMAHEVSKTLGTIHFGGPLSGPVVAVHGSSQLAEAETGEGVYVAADRTLLETLVKQKPAPYRLIVGHLGWTAQQLDAERHAGFWHVLDAREQDVFTQDEALWPTVIRRATTHSMTRWLGINQLPANVEAN
ncbi:YqgE/AlgH family protein [Stieleria sp. JC731]|uniref:YqgE/AlgH family protein n=1 Tax=Pirellulaceae TaxID=2691357 RepID=UPI001E43D2A1|nr:YqgE/AlgH family protein [Stieleria sp. JC731]MCC9599362.1 YqgE/AlgH family protein [Stieleria sp. JC731]